MSVVIFSLLSLVLFGIGVFFYKLGTPGFSSGLGASIYIASHLIVLGTVALFETTDFDRQRLKFLIIGGLFSGLAQIFFFLALQAGKVHVVVPIRNLSLLVTVLLGILILAERLTPVKSLGLVFGILALICLSI